MKKEDKTAVCECGAYLKETGLPDVYICSSCHKRFIRRFLEDITLFIEEFGASGSLAIPLSIEEEGKTIKKEKTKDYKIKCTLTNAELAKKAEEWLDKLIDTGGRCWCLPVPADPNKDVDLIFTELIMRFKDDRLREKEAEK